MWTDVRMRVAKGTVAVQIALDQLVWDRPRYHGIRLGDPSRELSGRLGDRGEVPLVRLSEVVRPEPPIPAMTEWARCL